MRHRVFILCTMLLAGACSGDSSTAPIPGGDDDPDPVTVRLDSYAGFKTDLEAP